VRFRIGSHLLVAEVERDESPVSPETGVPIRRLVVVFDAEDDAANAEYLDLLDACRTSASAHEHDLVSETEHGEFSGTWNIADASFGPIDGPTGTAWRHRWELVERPTDPSL
jgi:hypothetical protein